MADGSVTEEDLALEQAKSSGTAVELLSARTESSDTWVMPDGSFTEKQYGTPVRVERDGAWLPVDPTLEFTADGRVATRATDMRVTFSGGETAALMTGTRGGRTLTLSWPTPLPKPVLAANVATYTEVLPGVDLQLKADVEGFSQLLVVKTAEAAKNPALASLKYKVDTVGLTVSTDPDTNSINALDPAGQTVFSSQQPMMWDSTTISSQTPASARSALSTGPGDSFEPPPGAQDAAMPTTFNGDTLEIKPDQDLLTGPDTQYPVYIDPLWTAGWGELTNWTRVYKKWPKNSYWNSKEVARVGYENETNGLSRSLFQFDISKFKDATVHQATFRIRNVWSWSCQSRPVELWRTGDITKKTNWDNQPGKVDASAGPVDTVNDSKGWSSELCGAGNLEFNASRAAKGALGDNKDKVTLGLYAGNESDTFGWKKFDAKTAALEVRYNNPPAVPQSPGTSPTPTINHEPATKCTAGGLIGNAPISLHATISDPNGGDLKAQFQVFKAGSTTPVVDETFASGNRRVATLSVPDGKLPTGDYTWKVRAHDPLTASAWTSTCKFSVDRTRPSKPPVISSTQFPSGVDGWPAETGTARTTGELAFGANGIADVESFTWYTSWDGSLRDIKPGITTSFRPPGYGPHFIYAYSVDKAANRSDIATYLFYAKSPQERDQPGDLNGDGLKDIWNADSNGTLLTYANQTAPETSPTHDKAVFSAATNGGKALNANDSGQVTYNGDWEEDGDNDLLTLEHNTVDNRKNIRLFTNDGLGVVDPLQDTLLTARSSEDHWADARMIVSPGDVTNDAKKQPDLLVQEGSFLWLYTGSRSRLKLEKPVLVGNTGWDKLTPLTPGDITGDGLPDLWVRNDTTGDISNCTGSKGADGKLNAAAWGTNCTKIATGYPKSAYPSVGSIGDLTGDGIADLWARKSDNTMIGWPGKGTATSITSLGTAFTIDGSIGGARIPANTTLEKGQTLASRSAKLTMQDGGNLVVTSNTGTILWSTKTDGHPGATATMRPDGNLVVSDADGVKIWGTDMTAAANPGLTANGYAVLQDRGNLVIHTAKGQSLWSSGTAQRHDYNSDGRSDMADWYDHADESDTLHTFLTNSDGTFKNPLTGWNVPTGWTASRMKRTTGDYNGDGIGDVAAVYGYDDGQVALWTWLGTTSGKFAPPFRSWRVPAGNWSFPRMTVSSGDFNGDGRDDVAAWYDYADGHDSLWTFTANVRGGFNAPFESMTRPAGGWSASRDKQVTGDFNGDGRDDMAVFHGYTDGSSKIWTFLASPTGGFKDPVGSWTSTTWGSWDRTSVHAGDFDGDGRDDIAAWYDYADGHDSIYTFPSSATGTFSSVVEAWTTPAGSMWRDHMSIVIGDYNGDGVDDFGALYGYDDGSIKAWTWLAAANRKFAAPVSSWGVSSGYSFPRAYVVERYGS
ncbi:FG-GAP-like repeat-containing protein [Streptomyces clavifer]|uniref:FG-GAP-like repeat-containing protein n=1 Tax=Streptomyces clavifer TaxID=68188 RepID=UPI00380FAA2B